MCGNLSRKKERLIWYFIHFEAFPLPFARLYCQNLSLMDKFGLRLGRDSASMRHPQIKKPPATSIRSCGLSLFKFRLSE